MFGNAMIQNQQYWEQQARKYLTLYKENEDKAERLYRKIGNAGYLFIFDEVNYWIEVEKQKWKNDLICVPLIPLDNNHKRLIEQGFNSLDEGISQIDWRDWTLNELPKDVDLSDWSSVIGQYDLYFSNSLSTYILTIATTNILLT